jgi:hypothetical protein
MTGRLSKSLIFQVRTEHLLRQTTTATRQQRQSKDTCTLWSLMSTADAPLRRTAPYPALFTRSSQQPRVIVKYLTPHKILLVILIHAYCTSFIPTRSHGALFKFLLDEIEVLAFRYASNCCRDPRSVPKLSKTSNLHYPEYQAR